MATLVRPKPSLHLHERQAEFWKTKHASRKSLNLWPCSYWTASIWMLKHFLLLYYEIWLLHYLSQSSQRRWHLCGRIFCRQPHQQTGGTWTMPSHIRATTLPAARAFAAKIFRRVGMLLQQLTQQTYMKQYFLAIIKFEKTRKVVL